MTRNQYRQQNHNVTKYVINNLRLFQTLNVNEIHDKIIIIIIISYHRFPFIWYFFSWTSGAPHHSGFKFHIVAFSLLCTISSVQLLL